MASDLGLHCLPITLLGFLTKWIIGQCVTYPSLIMAGGAGSIFPSLDAAVTLGDHGWKADIIARNVEPCSGHGEAGDELSSLLLRFTRSPSPSTTWKINKNYVFPG